MLPSSSDSSSCVPADLLRASFLMGDATAGAAIRLAKRAQVQDQISIAALMEISASEWLDLWIEYDLCSPFNEQIGAVLGSLPSSADQLPSDEQLLTEPSALPPLTRLVFAIWQEHFAWCGAEEIGADVVLESADDETLEALAEFLWQHRHAGRSREETA